jgi:hypothetical protein
VSETKVSTDGDNTVRAESLNLKTEVACDPVGGATSRAPLA